MVYRKTRKAHFAMAFLLLVLASNFLLYQPSVQDFLSLQVTREAVIGSLIDLAIVVPFLFYLAFKISIKQTIGLMVAGLVIARLIIPSELFASYAVILYSGVAIEALLILAELGLLFLVIWKVPQIRRDIEETALFSLLPAVEKVVTKNIFIQIVMSELLMMYYVFFSWNKKAPNHAGVVTMHKKTSAVAMNIMLIHAIVIETIGLHWWLHEKSIVLSIIILILNIYTVLFFIADIQITRLHPLEIKNGKLYITQGLTARIIVPLSKIKDVEWGGVLPSKETLQFIYRDFEEVVPHGVIYLHEPIEATTFMGMKKSVTEFSIRVDEPEKLKALLGKLE
ncbi:beta-carotene 15,15'-monooxygenase [Psychrobacillus sp. NPDC058041]|uniref:beta-carotene 15,15'-monooxygenase n=1 Tax=Psychrobacillus sp. NPDC058041 TaxID=3346310 RepID=UPI0036DE7CAB